MTFQVKEKQWRHPEGAIDDGQRESVLSVEKDMRVCEYQPELGGCDRTKVAGGQGSRISDDLRSAVLPEAGTGNDHDHPESCP